MRVGRPIIERLTARYLYLRMCCQQDAHHAWSALMRIVRYAPRPRPSHGNDVRRFCRTASSAFATRVPRGSLTSRPGAPGPRFDLAHRAALACDADQALSLRGNTFLLASHTWVPLPALACGFLEFRSLLESNIAPICMRGFWKHRPHLPQVRLLLLLLPRQRLLLPSRSW